MPQNHSNGLRSHPSEDHLDWLRREIEGIDQPVPLLDGSFTSYINLDNAASTPSFRRVKTKIEEATGLYSSVHRGSGFKSLVSTYLYDEARRIVANFVGADAEQASVIFVKNTTEGINRLANRFPFQPGDMVLTSVMEHHSNDLPWRAHAQVLHSGIQADGSLDVDDFTQKLEQNSGKIKLVAITGASNVTGYLPPIHDLAELAHQHGAMIMVDCAQLLPHRPIVMGDPDDPRHLDFIAISAHKVYAPFGSGALIGAKSFFNQGDPDYRGGGTVEMVTLDEVEWTHTPERDEAGSPNVIGAVALAAALTQLSEVGMDAVAVHEAELTSYALGRLAQVSGVQVYGSTDPARVGDRVGVIPFSLGGMPHGLLAAILSFESGIGLRNGCFCAHPYVLRLIGVSNEDFLQHRARVMDHDRSDLPGFVRASFGCYNNRKDVDSLVEALKRIAQGDIKGDYHVHHTSGSYYPRGFELEQLSSYFSF